MRNLIVLASTTALLVAGASPGHATTPVVTDTAPTTTTTTTFSGEELFTGLLLGYGPVADQHPDLTTAGAVTGGPQEQAEFVTQLVDAVDQLDSSFFDTFAADITSGDPVLVDRAFQTGETVFHTALADSFDASIEQKIDDQSGTCVAVVVVAWVVTAGALVAAGTVNVGVNINVAYNVNHFWNLGSVPDNGAGLGYEKWINQLAATLA